jgi:alpha,alpha-trehalose phosphorylase
VIPPGYFGSEPWAVTETGLRLDLLGQTESIFALSNGHIGLRGNLDEGEPHALPGTYLNGFFESLPLPYAETAFGNPEQSQSLINVINGKLVRLLVDDEPFDVRQGTLVQHSRTLDLRDGVLRREVEWTSPAGSTVRIRSTRLVSFVQRAVAAVSYEVEAVTATRIVVQSTLVANEPLPGRRDDPRSAAELVAPLVGEYHRHHDLEVGLGHRTRNSSLRVAAAMTHVIDGPDDTTTETETEPDLARVTVSTELQPGERLRMLKLFSYGWSSRRSMPALRDQVDAALAGAGHVGWDGLVASQREYLDRFWSSADVELEGDPQLQQAVRFGLFHVVQAAARAERRAIPAKGLTGSGYDGHTFWDMETYVLPVLTYTHPHAARDALIWRHSILGPARARARELRLDGAAFPWRTISGQECSGYWPAGAAAFHVNADVSDAVRRYVAATGDDEFGGGPGLEILVETARMWRSLGHHDAEGCFRIAGVTGPDEYSALADDNAYTNLMAARNLREAVAAVHAHRERAGELHVGEEEVASWREAADAMVVPYDEKLGITSQADNFTRYRVWDFEATRPSEYPLMLHYPYGLLYSSQVVKQADLVLALYLCGDRFDAEQKLRDFDYYEQITVRDSSLSAPIQAIVAAEVGHLDLAYAYFRETALVDLLDVDDNTADGVHLASLAGTWLVAIAGIGGLRDHGDTLAFAPRLTAPLTRVGFRLVYRGHCLRVEIRREGADYELLSGDPLELLHHGERFRLEAGTQRTLACPRLAQPPPVSPPPGRAPRI